MTTCASNLRQIGQASLLYAQDNNGYFPSVTPPGPTCVWADSLTSYIKDDQIFWCPNLPTGEFHAGCPPFISGIPRYEGSYDLNAMQPAGFAVHDSKFTHPATTILALDGVGHFVFPANGTIPDSNFLLTEGVQVRHNGGDNVCFADGHVKWLRLESMVNRTMWLASD
jgi:prepilin-type processing-associated H-X9-DG protein